MKTEKIVSNKDKIIKGAITAGNTISTTFGPYGKTVFIADDNGVMTTKDGATVAKAIDFEDKEESIGSTILKAVSLKTNERAGDGTTTAAVLATDMLQNSYLPDGFTGKIQAENLSKRLAKLIEKHKKVDMTLDDLYNVALVSSNNDVEIANLIKEIFKDMNPNIRVVIEEGYQKTLIKESSGVVLGRGFLSPYPVERYDNPQVIYKDSLILLFDGKLKNPTIAFNAINIAQQEGKPLTIVAEEVSSDVLNILAKAHKEGVARSVVVMAPGVDYTRMELLEDISFITGAKIYSNQNKNIRKEGLGNAELVKVDRYSATAVNSKVNKEHLKNRVKKIKERIDNGELETEWHERKQKERIASLTGKVIRVFVGGATPEEKEEKKYRIEDAVNSALSALREGIVEGGGIIWLRLYKEVGLEFLKSPIKTLFKNAGVDEKRIADILKNLNKGYMFVEKEDGVDIEIQGKSMFQLGIVDSAVAATEAIKAALSISGLFATVGSVVINKNDGTINY